MTIRDTVIFDTTVHRVHSVELERIKGDEADWVKLVMTDVDGFRSILNVFGTNGCVKDSALAAAEKVCEELRAEINESDDRVSESEVLIDSAHKNSEETLRTLQRCNETKDQFCRLLDASHETIAQMEDSYKMLEDKLAAAIKYGKDADEAIVELEGMVREGMLKKGRTALIDSGERGSTQ